MKKSKKFSLILLNSLLCFLMLNQYGSGLLTVGLHSFPLYNGNYVIWDLTAQEGVGPFNRGTLYKQSYVGVEATHSFGERHSVASCHNNSFAELQIHFTGFYKDPSGSWTSFESGVLFNTSTNGTVQYDGGRVFTPFICPTPINMTIIGLALENMHTGLFESSFGTPTISSNTINITQGNLNWTYVEIGTNGIVTEHKSNQVYPSTGAVNYTWEYLNHSFAPPTTIYAFGSEFLVITGASVVVMVYILRRKTRVKKKGA